ncbi:hypothetical protein LMH87_011366 [Akanthomyces muscarius]|uniref:Uncharacterized protein n=1 Tax=Akanthomyces muscarius TaxID=2231603 RepID=A0A9W8Q9K3_AKAMU|nr:hypothetical protein LMH87_011366 [Akanthomyces muscarius]KAJ4150625.1 hypothetical protein LMH87_011366 [Akanthomyces muscarius]
MWTGEVEQNPAHQQDASRCLGIMLEYLEYRNIMPSKMDIALMTLMLNPSLATALLSNQGEAEAKRFDDLWEETLQIVDLKTAGLLEVGKDYEVRLIHRSAYTFLRESALAQQILHTDKTMPKQRQPGLMSGLLAYILICRKRRNGPDSDDSDSDGSDSDGSDSDGSDSDGSDSDGSDSDTSTRPVDADNVSHQSVNSPTAQLRSTWLPLSFKFCLSQEIPSCCEFLVPLQRYTRDWQSSDSEVCNLLSLVQIVYRSCRWTWGPCLITFRGLSGIPYRYKTYDPDFIGAAASVGFFDYVWASMKEFYATSPTGFDPCRYCG